MVLPKMQLSAYSLTPPTLDATTRTSQDIASMMDTGTPSVVLRFIKRNRIRFFSGKRQIDCEDKKHAILWEEQNTTLSIINSMYAHGNTFCLNREGKQLQPE